MNIKLIIWISFLLLCTSCRTHKIMQESSSNYDSIKVEMKKSEEKNIKYDITSYFSERKDSTEITWMQELSTINFDSCGKPISIQQAKKILLQSSTNQTRIKQNSKSIEQGTKKDSTIICANIQQNQYSNIKQKEDKSKNVLFSVMLSLLTLIICHLVLKHKIKQKKLGA